MMKRSDPESREILTRERSPVDPLLFATAYLRTHLRRPPAAFHRSFFQWHARLLDEEIANRRGRRLALAAPRGSAKSTIASLILPLHDIVFERERYILLISATARQAQQRLRALRAELSPGSELAREFGFPAPACSASTLRLGSVRVDAYGAASEMRGLTHGSWRPTKIILDDAESSAAANSPRRRERMQDWFNEVVEHLGAKYTHLIVVGTVLHPQGLLPTLLQRPDFESRLHRSIEEFGPPSPLWEEWRRLLTDPGVEDRRAKARAYFEERRAEMGAGSRVLWPAHEDYEELQAQLVTQGRRAFFQEKQNEPLGPENALFDAEVAWKARRTDTGYQLLAPGGGTRAERSVAMHEARRFGFLDTALGRSADLQRGDFAALATVLLFPGGIFVLADLWIHRAPPSVQIDTIIRRHAAEPFERMGVEGTGFQELVGSRLAEQSHEQHLPLPIEVVRPTRRKEARIAALEPLLASGRLVLSESLPEEFWRELSDFPRVEHDDALDAAAGAVELALTAARRAGAGGVAVAMRGGKHVIPN